MGSGNREKLDNPALEWLDSRLPIVSMLQKEYGVFPTPKNFNYFWNFGAIAMVMLILMIVTGIVLAMNYAANTEIAFDSVERIMRDVNSGWMLRYLHANGASFFFIAVYIHIFRGMYYGSYKQPRELLWMLGVLIFLLMMATAFMGYVLPWGQMSFWGATVITNLFSAIPLVGDSIVTLLWGGFSVDNPTLNRFFALHYLLPFVIVGVVFLHVWALHVTGSNNPSGIEAKGKQDTLPFHPYYTMKDTFGVLFFLTIFAVFAFFLPNALGHPDNYIPANPLVTPAHIVPEWYFLPFYAILRAVTFDLNPYLALAGGIIAYVTWKHVWLKEPKDPSFLPDWAVKMIPPTSALLGVAGLIGGVGLFLMYAGTSENEAIQSVVGMVRAVTDKLPLYDLILVPAKLGGVLAMFGSIAMLFILPFLDKHPVRSSRYRPWFKWALIAFVVNALLLGLYGGKPAEGFWVPLSQISTAYYFAFFLVVIQFLNNKEPVPDLPDSISAAVLQDKKAA